MRHRAFCETFLEALGRADYDAMAGMTTPGFTVHEAAGLPYAGVYEGIEGWKALTAAVRAAWSGLRVRLVDIPAEGPDCVVVHLHLTGRGRGTGTEIDMPVLELWTLQDGRLAEIRPFYWDTHAAAVASGAAA